jgi:hypothetical protein
MPLLQTLEIHEVITAQAVDIQRASLKRQVRDVANGARNFAMGLRRRMNALGNRDSIDTGDVSAVPEQEEAADVPAVSLGGDVQGSAKVSQLAEHPDVSLDQ